MPLDADWAISELDIFLDHTSLIERHDSSIGRYNRRKSSDKEIIDSAVIVEQILDRVVPDWRDVVANPRVGSRHDRWDERVELCRRARVLLTRESEIRSHLGDDAPRLDAAQLHPWVWDAAKALWSNGHFREAVGVAAIQINAATQDKIGRLDISEIDLFNQAFSIDPPELGKSRLRLMDDDGSRTFGSLHRGVRAFAEGCYAAIRNPISHTPGQMSQTEALEQLAALSVLARWVDEAKVVRK